MIPTYKTLSDKAKVFESHTLDDFDDVVAQLSTLEAQGYFFRGQADASWKLYTAIQREWLTKNLHNKFESITACIQQHVEYQRANAASQLNGQQLNDISILSTLQHYDGPTPFLDFTSKPDSALYFATDNAPAAGVDEATQYISIYAWKPGNGPATASTNDLTNWESIIDNFGGINEAASLSMLQGLTVFYIKQDSGEFLKIANPRLDLQNGLFVYAPKALRNDEPYEAMFNGKTIDDVVDVYQGLFIPKLICLNIAKSMVPAIKDRPVRKGITRESLGLASADWARQVYQDFLNSI